MSITQLTNELLTNKNLNNALTKALKYLGKATNVDRVYIFNSHIGNNGEQLYSQQYEWTKENISLQINNPDLQNIPSDAFGDLSENFRKGKVLNSIVKNVEPNLRGLLESQEIVSILIVPIIIDKQIWGFIGFDDCKND